MAVGDLSKDGDENLRTFGRAKRDLAGSTDHEWRVSVEPELDLEGAVELDGEEFESREVLEASTGPPNPSQIPSMADNDEKSKHYLNPRAAVCPACPSGVSLTSQPSSNEQLAHCCPAYRSQTLVTILKKVMFYRRIIIRKVRVVRTLRKITKFNAFSGRIYYDADGNRRYSSMNDDPLSTLNLVLVNAVRRKSSPRAVKVLAKVKSSDEGAFRFLVKVGTVIPARLGIALASSPSTILYSFLRTNPNPINAPIAVPNTPSPTESPVTINPTEPRIIPTTDPPVNPTMTTPTPQPTAQATISGTGPPNSVVNICLADGTLYATVQTGPTGFFSVTLD